MVKGDDAHWVFRETAVHVLLLGDHSKHWDPPPTTTTTQPKQRQKEGGEQSSESTVSRTSRSKAFY